jgi:hypothetical protein
MHVDTEKAVTALGVSMVARTSQNDGCFQAYR